MREPGGRAYRALLRMFPRRFRERNSTAMGQLFAEMRAAWEEERGRVGPRFWAALTWDTACAATAEWFSLLGDTIRPDSASTVGETMSAMLGDLRFAIRQLVRQPMYGFMIVLLMALGIAGNAAVFRVFNGLFLKPLPFDQAEQLVDINETAPAWDLEFLSVAFRDFAAWRDGNETFQSMAALTFGGGNLVMADGASRVDYLSTTHEIDEVLRIEPLFGRFYGPEDDHHDASRTALLSEPFWQQQFAGDRDVIGRTVSLNGYQVEIIGVLPPEAGRLDDADMWIPMQADPDEWRGWGLNAIGRLRPDVSVEQARADLMSIHKGLIPQWEVNEISSPVIDSLRDRYLGDYKLGSGFLLGAVAVVLLLACANIAGLMTVRAMARAPEMGIRLAMGAPRGRIVRQLLTESLLLATVGAAVGGVLGVWGSSALVGPLHDQFPAWVSFDLDGRFLAFTLLVTVGAALVFGLAPALQAARGAGEALSSRTTHSGRRRRAMNVLVAGEVALALVLLVIGGLTVVDVQRLGRSDPGFEPDGIMSYSLSLPSQRYDDDMKRLAFAEQYLDRLGTLPGVESATIASALPLGGQWGWAFVAEGQTLAEGESNPIVLNRVVSSSYFETMGVQFVAGRPFDDFDGREDGTRVVVVNETFVRAFLSHLDDPIGARVYPSADLPEDGEIDWMTVVGVTRDVKHYGVDNKMRTGVYQPLVQFPLQGFQVALRTTGDPATVMSGVRSLTAEVDVELPVYSVASMTDELNEALYARRATSWMIGLFSTVALLMAIAGIYGVISYTVGQRSQEISIRMAMGAEKETVLRGVLGQGMRLVVLGSAIGLALSLAGARVVSGILVGVSPTDPTVYAAVTSVVLFVAAVANYLPARRAARLDPMRALRGE